MGRRAIDEANEAKLAAMRAEFREIEEALACCLARHAPLFEAVRARGRLYGMRLLTARRLPASRPMACACSPQIAKR